MAQRVAIDFEGNIAGIEKSTRQATKILTDFEARAKSISEGVNVAFSALGTGLTVAGFAGLVKSGIDAADALNDMSDRTGIAVEKLAGFQLATKLADTNMEEFQDSVNKLSINIGKSADDFAKLGISAKDPAEAFLQLADVYSKIENPQQRAAFGAAALGKSYAEMAPLLNQGGAALRQQITQGQKFSGVTQENAKAAADFNDRLDQLGQQSQGFRIRFALGVLEPLSAYAVELDKAITKSGVFQGTLAGLAEGFKRSAIESIGGFSTYSNELNDINVKVVEAKDKLKAAQEGGFFGKNSADEIAAQQALNNLLAQRTALVDKLNKERQKQTSASTVGPPSDSIQNFIKKNGDPESQASKSAKKAQSDLERLNSEYDTLVANLTKEVSLRGDNSELAALEYDVAQGSLSKLTESQKLVLLNLAAEKQALQDNMEQYKEYDAIIEQGQDLARQQVKDQADLIDRLSEKYNANSVAFKKGVADVQDALRYGIIDEARAKAEFDQLGKDFNDGFSDPASKALKQLDAYSEQAARNMQDAFADFLFDPFKDGVDGMLVNFLNTIRQMVAQQAAAQLFGSKKDGGSGLNDLFNTGVKDLTQGISSYGSEIFSGIGSFFGFADGAAFSAGNVVPFASGGIFNQPTYFPMSGNRTGLLGEAGPEAIMPLRRDGSGRLGVSVHGGGSSKVINFTQNINIATAPNTREGQSNLAYQIGLETKRALDRNG